MERTELLRLIRTGLVPETAPEKFSVEDCNNAAVNAILEQFGLKSDSSLRDIRRYQPEIMALIEEEIEEILPKRLENVMGTFAEIKSFARNDQVQFNLTKLGKRRARLSITKGARGGLYRTARLDARSMELETEVTTVGLFLTLEDIILGTYTLAELFSNILEGFQEILYKGVIDALIQTQISGSDTPNYYTVDGELTLEEAVDEAIMVVKQYGSPMIIGFSNTLSKLANISTGGTPTRPQADLNDIRDYGYIQKYKGNTNIIEIPNYLKDDSNLTWELDDDYAFVIPADSKPVKVALQGELTIIENKQSTGSEKWEAHKLTGIGVLLSNDYAVIKVK